MVMAAALALWAPAGRGDGVSNNNGNSGAAEFTLERMRVAPIYAADEPTPAPPPAAEPTERSLLNGTLYQSGFGQSLIDKGFDFGGWIEGSLTYDTVDPPGNLIPGRVF